MEMRKSHFLYGFASIVALLAVTRLAFPSIAEGHSEPKALRGDTTGPSIVGAAYPGRFFNADGTEVRNKVLSVPGYSVTFPDENDIQLAAAQRHGVSPVEDREDAERRKTELVYVAASPFYKVDKLNRSIPYLVPRASELLQEIGQAYYDSLQAKGKPLHRFIVTSLLRTRNDVDRLRTYNRNATQNSCHLYGTTFDISYNRYETVEALTDGERVRKVPGDTLKWILSEVLRDFRKAGKCYVKYEVKQACFHITAR